MAFDPHAADELYRITGQLAVPVLTVDGNVVVGFDQARLDQLLAEPER